MSSPFKIIEHQSPCQTIREYPQCTSTFQEDVLQLSVKQYIPLHRKPRDGDVTILACHASAFPKELYEPLWEDLLKKSEKAGFGIRSIWMADVANQGASYVLNENKTGNDPNFADHARDLLCLVNNFRSDFTRPIIGIGHSMGASSLTFLSLMHPRLLSSLIFIDPVIPSKTTPALYTMAKLPSFRKDFWASRKEAESAFLKNALIKGFDARVVDRVLQHSIRPTPTLLYPEAPKQGEEQSYTLTTPKHQEALSIARPNYSDIDVEETPDANARASHPDIWPDAPYKSPFYKSEGRTCFKSLPNLRPSVLYLYGSKSYAADPEERALKLERTGTGWNGSGGAELGRVKEELVEGAGHFLCFERVKDCADKIANYLDGEMESWRQLEGNSVSGEWREKDTVGRQTLDDKWLVEVKKWKGQREVPSSKL